MSNNNITPAVEKLIHEALAIEAEEAQQAGALAYMARAMTLASLPHSRVDGNEFTRTNGAFSLSLLAPSSVGLPYGAVPRLLLCWLTSEAVRTQSRELELGDSLSGFMSELGLVPTWGRWGTVARVKAQTTRLFAASVTATYQDKQKTAILNQPIAEDAVLWWDAPDPAQAGLWKSKVTLTEKFFREVVDRPVPVDMRALQALKKSPMALDIYVAMTHRAHYQTKETTVPWESLQARFGADYKLLRQFKAAFLRELKKVQTVYSGLRVEPGVTGLVFKPSRTHIRGLK